ncbi:hypothetical protein MF271_05075 [Deinococcus sp. KNUC1210]|uniref:hypothetical protein n=1 Tax=Deinococcus sp. KNUC1210 TaxID=2917691 RepID=UPI001EF08F05|nr:hypothetical protein [Deinococcus sp. KNUC1210]ULH16008.1 hypothetical protein MF271_05075 [Deinococcus sp. KNUC1210]
MSLTSTMNGLLKKAEGDSKKQTYTLPNGLHVRAAANPARLCLWRTEGEWRPSEAAEREGRTCAKVLGWTGYRLFWQGQYLIVEVGPGLRTGARS